MRESGRGGNEGLDLDRELQLGVRGHLDFLAGGAAAGSPKQLGKGERQSSEECSRREMERTVHDETA